MNPVAPPQAGASILVVDDTPANLQLFDSLLQKCGYAVRVAISGSLALRAARLLPPDLILLDVRMPKMDGYEAMRQIRANTRFNKLPVIALTAKAMKEDREKCIQAGANDYITKPVDIDRLLALMQIWLRQ